MAKSCLGVTGIQSPAEKIDIVPGSLVYIDPPYQGTTAYGYTLAPGALMDRISLGSKCYVSEGVVLSETAQLMSPGRAKGGISGDRAVIANEEWLSWKGPVA